MAGIYIHIPYCKSKCIYCDFYSRAAQLPDWHRFCNALLKEFESRRYEISSDTESFTIYIGGGTPSLIPSGEFRFLLDSIFSILTGRYPHVPVVETTIEVNPDDVTPELCRCWKESGITRVSMGVQTMSDTELNIIGRRHNAQHARKAFDILRREFANISLDLMFGLPTQTLESLSLTLDSFIKMRPEHISAYSLMYEERTAIWKLREQGKIKEMEEDTSVKMFEMVSSKLAKAGYERYEISNYALPGHRSRHNSSYWQGVPYIGLGPSAHSYDGKTLRRWNLADTGAYIDKVEKGEIFSEKETLGFEELREERIMTSLRTIEGLSLQRFEESFGQESMHRLQREAAPFLHNGTLLLENDHLRLSDTGVMISDEIISSLF